jgi:hypothetical protein
LARQPGLYGQLYPLCRYNRLGVKHKIGSLVCLKKFLMLWPIGFHNLCLLRSLAVYHNPFVPAYHISPDIQGNTVPWSVGGTPALSILFEFLEAIYSPTFLNKKSGVSRS